MYEYFVLAELRNLSILQFQAVKVFVCTGDDPVFARSWCHSECGMQVMLDLGDVKAKGSRFVCLEESSTVGRAQFLSELGEHNVTSRCWSNA